MHSKHFLSLSFLVCAMALSTAAHSLAGILPINLQTEYRTNPLGIDRHQPRLSWELKPSSSSDRGAQQTAFQLLVATDPKRLSPGQADLWDSGEVRSSATAHIVYSGKPLESRQQCFWTVRATDQTGRWSDWTRPAQWSMGLLQTSDWTGKWIGTGETFKRGAGSPPPDNALPDPWFRKSFELDAKPRRALAFVASVGYHELYVNGKKIGDAVLAPNVTDHTKRARYEVYDIGASLRPGKNTIGLWLGTGWSIFPKFETTDKPRAPIVLAEFDLEFDGGKTMHVATDQTWKTHPSPNRLLGVWDFMHFGGEEYDANKEVKEWSSPNLDDSSWKPVATFTPKLILSADLAEPNKLMTPLRAASVTEPKPGIYRIDMGRNFSGWTEIEVRGRPGDRVEFQFSEQPDEPMTHRLRSVYVIGRSGRGTFKNRFNYSVGRWITVTGLHRKPSAGDFRGWLVRSSYEPASGFECSNRLLNEIYRTTLWTFENLTLGAYAVDCPHRERMGYGGDAHATTTTGLSNYRMGAFYTKWSEDWRDVQGRGASWGTGAAQADASRQLEEGNLPYTAPTYWGGGGPGWSGFCVHLPWELYQRYGDRQILRDNFQTIGRWLSFLETKTKANLLRRWGGEWDFLGDWLWPGAKGVNGDTRETLFFNNCYWIYNLQTAARIARILGENEKADGWSRRADEARRAVHEEFFDLRNHSYVNGGQAYLAIALHSGVTPDGMRAAVFRQLQEQIVTARKGHIDAGITGGAFLFKALMALNHDDLIYTMVNQRDYPSWGAMLREGATTFWESWENNKTLSYLHSSYLYVGGWLIHGVLGIQPDPENPGFKHFLIRPGPLDQPDLSWAKGYYDSIHGRISSEWRRKEKEFELAVDVPPNTSATIFLPGNDVEMAAESGHPLNRAAGVKLEGIEHDQIKVRVDSGQYRFVVRNSR